MSVKRVVDTEFWVDDKVVENFSPEDKLFMLYLMTNPHTTQLGIYAISKKIMGFELGYSLDTIGVLIDRFENKYNMIKYSTKTNEIAIKNYLKYSIIKGGKPVEDLLNKEIKLVKDKSLISYVYSNIIDYTNLNETVKTIITKYNDNVNDNDVSLTTIRPCIVKDDLERVSKEYENIKKQVLEDKEKNEFVCDWCGCKTNVIHNHHYPIPKRLGGKDVVHICANCHDEFHKKESSIYGTNDTNLENKKEENYEEEFEQLWKLYPKKEGKKDALKHYIVARRNGTTYEQVENGIKRFNDAITFYMTEYRYIPMGSSWFNQEKWNDEYLLEKKEEKKSKGNIFAELFEEEENGKETSIIDADYVEDSIS